MNPKSLETLYSVDEAAKNSEASPSSRLRMDERGLLERTRVGGRVMVRESSLLKLLQQGSEQHQSPQGRRFTCS